MKGLREHPPGSGRYELAFYNKNRHPRRKYVRFAASSIDTAERQAHKLRDQYERGDFDPWNDKKASIPEAIKLYIEAHGGQRKNTITNKETALRLFTRYVPITSFQAITENNIRDYAANFDKPNTLNNRMTVIGHFWRWAIAEGYAKKNPVEEYARKNKIGRRVQSSKAQRESMTPAEYLDLYRHAVAVRTMTRKRSYYFPPIMDLCTSTGLRVSEAVSLNVRDVTLAPGGMTGSIHIREWIHPRTGQHFVPKHERERTVPLTPRAATILNEHMPKTEDEWQPIFVGETGGALDYTMVSDKFTEARREMGYPDSITFHSTRHTFLTWLIMLSVDPYAVMEVAGHGDLKTQQRYIHYKNVMLSGGASEMRREIVRFLCPGISDDALAIVFPDKAGWYGSLVSSSPLPILDVLFGGMLYDEAFVAMMRQRRMRVN